MRKFTGTWIIVAVFAAMLAFLLLGKPKSRREAREDALRLADADREKLERVEIENTTGTIVLEKAGDGWKVTAPRESPVEESALNQVKNGVDLVATDEVWPTAGEEERAKTGLAKPAAVVRWKAGEKAGTLEISSLTKDRFYVTSSRKEGIFAADKWNLEIFLKGFTDFRRRKLVEFDRDAVRTLLVEIPGREPFMVSRTDALAPWIASTPFTGRADRGSVNGLLTRLSNLRAESFVDEPKWAEGIEPLAGKIALTADQGKTWIVLVGKPASKDAKLVPAREGTTGQVILADTPLVADLSVDFRTWRDKALADFFVDDVQSVELALEKGPLVVSRDADGLFAVAGKPVNPEATNLARAIRDSTVSEFGPEAPAGSPKAKELGLESPVVAAKLVGEDGKTYEIAVGATKPGTAAMRWVRTSESPTALLLDAEAIVKAAAALASAAAAPPASPTPEATAKEG